MIPELPALPDFPDLLWFYKDGFYCLDEQNVDLLLDYRDNQIPLYEFQMEQYQEQLQIVLDGFK